MKNQCMKQWFAHSNRVTAVLLVVLVLSMVQVPSVAAQESVSLVVTSAAGDPWSDGSSTGSAVLTYGHIGCSAVNESGTCTGGIWPKLEGAQWIWKSQNVTPEEATAGSNPVTFSKSFSLPENAWNIAGEIQISADDTYELYLNGTLVGNNGDWSSVETYSITPQPGANLFEVKVQNYAAADLDPWSNPAGLVFKAVITYSLPLAVQIDIKPGDETNCFNNDGHGVIPVAILSSATFDATAVDPATVQLDGQALKAVGKSNKLLASVEDVNGDGLNDLVVQIEDTDGTYQAGDTTAVLTGSLYDGTPIQGVDTICIVP